VINGGDVIQAGMAIRLANGDVIGAAVVLLINGRILGDEKPWIVVTTGVRTRAE